MLTRFLNKTIPNGFSKALCLLGLIVFSITPGYAFSGQVQDEFTPSPEEKREALEVSQAFYEQLQKTRDITFLLHEESARPVLDFGARFLHETFLKPTVVKQAKPDELREFAIVMVQMTYLSNLYKLTQLNLKKDSLRDVSPEQEYPPQVFQVLQKNPTIARWWNGSTSTKISSLSEMQNLLTTWKKATSLMQEYFTAHSPEQSELFQKNMLILGDSEDVFVIGCPQQGDCGQLPQNTRLIVISKPLAQIMLTRVDGKLKVVFVGPPAD